MAPQAGWYVDPKDARQYRYWDGERWSQSTQPIPTETLAAAQDASGTLGAGGAQDPVGSGAFGAASTASTAVSHDNDGPLADFMWTNGFGSDAEGDLEVTQGSSMFSAAEDRPAAPIDPAATPWTQASPSEASGSTPSPPSAFGGAPAAPTPPAPPTPTPYVPPDAAVVDDAGAGAFAPMSDPAAVGGGALATPGAPPMPGAPPEAPGGKRRRGKKGDDAAPGADGGAKRSRKDTAAVAGAGALAGAPEGETATERRKRKAAAKAAGKASAPTPPARVPGSKPAEAPKSRLPLLLGILGVIVVGAAVYLLFFNKSDDDVTATEPNPTASVAETTDAPTTAADATTDAPTTVVVTTTAATATTIAPDVIAGLLEQFNAEATRACDVIKADPGLLTENVIRYDQAWSVIPKTYEDLQRSVNECSFQARDEAFKKIAGGG